MSSGDPSADASLARARALYEDARWRDAFEAFDAAQQEGTLDAEDLDRWAWSAALVGEDGAFVTALERLYQLYDERHQRRAAARAAFWIGFRMLAIDSTSHAMAWLARAERQLDDGGEGDACAERGYLLIPRVLRELGAGEHEAAEETARRAVRIGEACGDKDLVSFARGLEARSLLRRHEVERGLALLDEVMLSVTSRELTPMVTGIVYCNSIATCQQMLAMDRAREWTAALAEWCEGQPQIVTFTGYCLVHRSEVMQFGGAWPEALTEVRQVCERLRPKADPEIYADACYQQAELLRLRGDHEEAERAYVEANRHGREPQPGLALLRMAQGRPSEGLASLERILSTEAPPWERVRMLPAFVEVAIAAGALDAARAKADELEEISREFGTEVLDAMSCHANGEVALAEGRPKTAIEPLQRACTVWRRAGAPYLCARMRVLLARAYEALGDREGAALELDAARNVFEDLGAGPDLASLDPPPTKRSDQSRLSTRELEVLRLVALGKTNKVIARELFVSERTIHRHVSNIFKKIDVTSRAAATAYAYEHSLV